MNRIFLSFLVFMPLVFEGVLYADSNSVEQLSQSEQILKAIQALSENKLVVMSLGIVVTGLTMKYLASSFFSGFTSRLSHAFEWFWTPSVTMEDLLKSMDRQEKALGIFNQKLDLLMQAVSRLDSNTVMGLNHVGTIVKGYSDQVSLFIAEHVAVNYSQYLQTTNLNVTIAQRLNIPLEILSHVRVTKTAHLQSVQWAVRHLNERSAGPVPVDGTTLEMMQRLSDLSHQAVHISHDIAQAITNLPL